MSIAVRVGRALGCSTGGKAGVDVCWPGLSGGRSLTPPLCPAIWQPIEAAKPNEREDPYLR
jgi:hypothetical protein